MYTEFETEITVRPDDIDMNNHVHYSKYLDYLLMARYDQMAKDYKLSMEEFIEMGFGWVASTAHIEYRRQIRLNNRVLVRTRLESFSGAQCRVLFKILNKETKKISAEGYVDYTMVSLNTGKAIRIPPEIIEKYAI